MSDIISRQAVDKIIDGLLENDSLQASPSVWHGLHMIKQLPSAQQEPEEFEWCTDCKEYDQTAHCCHRWTKVIRNTVDELKQPTVDAVPVIRCKDCKYHDISTFRELVLHRCYVNADDVETSPDGYCYLAERKEE